MRRVYYNPYYSLGKVMITGDNLTEREVLVYLIAIEVGLLIVEFKDEGYDSADYTY